MRSPILIRPFVVIILVLLIQSCTVNPYSNILFENRSGADIDSAVVSVQNYRMVFRNVSANTSINRQIYKDSVSSNNGSFNIRTRVFAKSTVLGEGAFSNGSSAEPDVMYTITFKNDHTINIHPGSVNAIRY